ncbi:TetR/AcrR family transcriptional regulator [Rhodococcoides corynebacterioides]|uniref:TetR/AcrR family transcriptional regulator n=1 Tax=Rhodococcoides corynebacterioides TaxID=53972 RepID=UPI001C9BA22B|nr:TetR/AcrR family transcriptional regulator [Rhodococcus corynebacterioides]MBY6364671.1 TetR/AcrR family transcriptional regulator [Rhodococcus corynebacterioides]
MAIMKRTRLSPDERRSQLIELGVSMLSGRPLSQISVDEIADQAGVSRGLLFHYFSSKDEYHLAIVDHISQEMLESTAPPDGLGPIETLMSTLTAYVDYVSANRTTYVSLLRGTASGDPATRAVFERTRDAMVDRTLAQLPLVGIEPTPLIHLAIRGWIAFCEEATVHWLRDELLSREELIALLTRALPAVALGPDDAAALLAERSTAP